MRQQHASPWIRNVTAEIMLISFCWAKGGRKAHSDKAVNHWTKEAYSLVYACQQLHDAKITNL